MNGVHAKRNSITTSLLQIITLLVVFSVLSSLLVKTSIEIAISSSASIDNRSYKEKSYEDYVIFTDRNDINVQGKEHDDYGGYENMKKTQQQYEAVIKQERLSNIDSIQTPSSFRKDIEQKEQIYQIRKSHDQNPSPVELQQRFAYVFLIAGCNPDEPSYRGYIYNVAIAKELLSKQFGSSNDVIVMIRMHLHSKYDTLPYEDEQILTKVGIIVKYIPKPTKVDNFHTAMMDKFRILEFLHYTRILYLDADIMPLNNLDYMFELSVDSKSTNNESSVFEENVGIAYNNEPVSGGFFMLTPKESDYERIKKIIANNEQHGGDFDQIIGWGHRMTEEWESLTGPQGTKWDFYGSFTDQGLLYYWTKYVKKKVTIINGDRIKTWNTDGTGTLHLHQDIEGSIVFENITKSLHVDAVHRSRAPNLHLYPPYRDFHHFKELHKPWLVMLEDRIDHGPHQFWFTKLNEINEAYNLQIDTENIVFDKPSLGIFPSLNMIKEVKLSKH